MRQCVVVPWLYPKHHCRSWYSASWCWAHTACSSSSAAAHIVWMSWQWPAAQTMHCHRKRGGKGSGYVFYITVDRWCCLQCSAQVQWFFIYWIILLSMSKKYTSIICKSIWELQIVFIKMFQQHLIRLWNILCCWVLYPTKICGLLCIQRGACIAQTDVKVNLGQQVREGKYNSLSVGAYASKG